MSLRASRGSGGQGEQERCSMRHAAQNGSKSITNFYSGYELVEFYTIESYKPSNHEDRAHRKIRISASKEVRTLEGYTMFTTNRLGGHCLALFLEPQSKVGLHRYNGLGLQILENSVYPIMRVLGSSDQ